MRRDNNDRGYGRGERRDNNRRDDRNFRTDKTENSFRRERIQKNRRSSKKYSDNENNKSLHREERFSNKDRKYSQNDKRRATKTFNSNNSNERVFRQKHRQRKTAYERYKEEQRLAQVVGENKAGKQIQPKVEDGEIRLNKYIANAGVCSRREADVLIQAGAITVNDEVITTLGYKVQPGDVVKYNGRILNNEKKIYILLNKPKGYITTSDDPQQRKTVMELIAGACKERVYPVGRLDRNTTGLLLLTNDGEMTTKLTHPSFGAQKVYNVELDHNVSNEDMQKLLDGVELEDGVTKVDNISYLNNVPMDKKKVGVSLHSGKNRIVRRLFEALGYEVKKLDRVYFAGLTKKNLLRGQYRFLTDQEIGYLHMQR